VCRDLSPERADAILEYLYHHNVCNSVCCGFWTLGFQGQSRFLLLSDLGRLGFGFRIVAPDAAIV